MQKFSYLKSVNAEYIDDVFARYNQDPSSVDESWRYFFEGLELGTDEVTNGVHEAATNGAASANTAPVPSKTLDLGAEAKVAELIHAYRENGRLLADVNPLNAPPSAHPSLDLKAFDLSDSDLSKTFSAGKLIGIGPATLGAIIQHLKDTYCQKVAVEFTHIQDKSKQQWLENKMEAARNRENLEPTARKKLLYRVAQTETFERFLHTRYVAQKRFSVEGGEAVIPSLDRMIEVGAELGAKEFVLGMAHRGRLNVLTHIFGKKPETIFTEFEGTYKVDLTHGEGDVKYHKGYSTDLTTASGKPVHLSLASNPSHLEFVNPVIEGVARAKQDRRNDTDRSQVIPIQIHGDAAFAGQGVCYETLNMSQLAGYSTGGTLHIVINNQVGFTTSPTDARSTPYCTDVAKMLDSPIFHVNGDDAEAVWYVSKLATEFRQQFKTDVFIDIICYRKHGHNEGDEPSFTQPLLYKKIKAHPSPRDVYAQALIQKGVISEQDATAMVDEITANLSAAQQITKATAPYSHASVFEGAWEGLKQPEVEDLFKPIKTAVEASKLKAISEIVNHLPASFHLHPKLARFFEARLKAVEDGKGIDWGNGEALAYASLVAEGSPVRLSGQDAERGTFTHRHAVLSDFETGETYTPFQHISNNQAAFTVYNSHLSETGVLGFEYGYSLASPQTLVIWEAQFGDFSNGAQVIIDQFIASGESKWQRMSGIVLLLPHGYEGQGPEHSSARLERFLALAGKNNMSVVNLTTPAQIFHALRRQVLRDFRKPLVVMSPKSLLRHPQAVSELKEFTDAGFQEILDDPEFKASTASKPGSAAEPSSKVTNGTKVKKVILCTGKVFYELNAERASRKAADTAIIRIEQIYPWPEAKLASLLKRYPNATSFVWAQEEPKNMGAWFFVFGMWAGGFGNFQTQVGNRPIRYAGREVGASPAVGSPKVHELQTKEFLEQAFGE